MPLSSIHVQRERGARDTGDGAVAVIRPSETRPSAAGEGEERGTRFLTRRSYNRLAALFSGDPGHSIHPSASGRPVPSTPAPCPPPSAVLPNYKCNDRVIVSQLKKSSHFDVLVVCTAQIFR